MAGGYGYRRFGWSCAVVAWLAVCGSAFAEDPLVPAAAWGAPSESFDFSRLREQWNRWYEPCRPVLANRLEIGARLMRFSLSTTRDDSLIGSIDELHAQQSNKPVPFVVWRFIPYLGVELSWARVEARTWTSDEAYTDGSVIMTGPVLALLGMYPYEFQVEDVRMKLTPYAGIGVGLMDGRFHHAGWWHYGFGGSDAADAQSRYDAWKAAGSPPWPNGGYERTMAVEDATALVLTAGCAAAVTDRVSLDLHLRRMSMDANNTFILSHYGEAFQTRYSDWPMSHVAWGLGVKYTF